jgi:hypothetical protein
MIPKQDNMAAKSILQRSTFEFTADGLILRIEDGASADNVSRYIVFLRCSGLHRRRVVQSVLPIEAVANVDTWTWTPSLGTGVRIMVLLPLVLNAMPVIRVAPLYDRIRHVRTCGAMAGVTRT